MIGIIPTIMTKATQQRNVGIIGVIPSIMTKVTQLRNVEIIGIIPTIMTKATQQRNVGIIGIILTIMTKVQQVPGTAMSENSSNISPTNRTPAKHRPPKCSKQFSKVAEIRLL